jgi:RNA polymerase sigma-70 factor (ECF subfamily)
MPETSLSLLDRLSNDSDPDSWQRLVDLYTPLLKQWLRRYDVFDPDADDLVQDVLLVVTRELPEFRHNQRQGAFRSWLKAIVVNRLRNHWRARKTRPNAPGGSDFTNRLAELQDDTSGLSRIWSDEHDRQVIRGLLLICQAKFTPTTWQTFRRMMIDGVDADVVAAEFGITPNSVYIAKSRVLAALRREAAGLLD